MHGWQSESTNGPKGVVLIGMFAVATSPTTTGCGVVVVVA